MTILGLTLGLMLLLIVLGIPISVSMLLSGIIVFWFSDIPLGTIVIRIFNGTVKYELIAIPLFLAIGNILSESGLATRLIAFAESLVGFMRGGLAMVNVTTSMIMAEMSGAGTADAAILSKIFIPNMVRSGYSRGFSAAVTSASASLGIIIPPSIPMIILALYTDLSVSQLFLAGLIPGLLLTLFQIITCYVAARVQGYPVGKPFSVREVVRSFLHAWFVFLIPVCILGSIFTGFATITEAAEVGLLIAIIGGVVYGKMGPLRLAKAIGGSIRQTAVIMLIIAGSTLISWIFAEQMVAQKLLAFFGTLALPTWGVLLLMMIFFIVLGTFMQSTATIIIVAPLVLPIAINLGMDPIQYGMMVIMGQAIGQQTPPVATVLLTVSSVSKVPLEEILPSLSVLLISFIVVLLLITFVPWVSTAIPRLFAG